MNMALDFSSYLLEAPNHVRMLPSQISNGCSLLSHDQEHCKMIGWLVEEDNEKAILHINMPYLVVLYFFSERCVCGIHA